MIASFVILKYASDCSVVAFRLLSHVLLFKSAEFLQRFKQLMGIKRFSENMSRSRMAANLFHARSRPLQECQRFARLLRDYSPRILRKRSKPGKMPLGLEEATKTSGSPRVLDEVAVTDLRPN
jgi:hypothetical protein